MNNIIFFLTVLFFTSSLTAQPSPLIYPGDAQEELQASPYSSLENSLRLFTAKGGTLIRLDGGQAPFILLPGDAVYPSCSGGNNRSQTLWKVLCPYASKIALNAPHATQYGLDPFNGQVDWTRVRPRDNLDEFSAWSGFSKKTKFGWDTFQAWLTKTEATPKSLPPCAPSTTRITTTRPFRPIPVESTSLLPKTLTYISIG